MKNFTKGLLIPLISFPFYGLCQLRAPSDNDPLESILIRENLKMDTPAGFHSDIWVTNQLKNQADPDKGVIINLTELKHYFALGDVAIQREAIRLVIAHEKVHMLQYRLYGYSNLKNASPALKRVMECQADIVAAKVFYESTFDRLLHDMTTNTALQDTVLRRMHEDALNLMLVLGEGNYSLGDHPSREQRRMAFKVGRLYGDLNYQQYYLNMNGFKMSPADIGNFNNNMMHEGKIIEFIPYENVMVWGLRQAKRILHYNDQYAKDILFEVIRQDWHKTSNNPYVDYALNVVNNSSKTLAVDFDIKTERVNRKDPGNTLKSGSYDAINYYAVLQPGQTQTYSGTLNWNFFLSDQDQLMYMPRIVRPGDPNSLISVENVNEPGLSFTGGGTAGNLALNDNQYHEINNVPFIIEKIRNMSNSISGAIAGPGLKFSLDGTGSRFSDAGYPCFNSYSNITLFLPEQSSKFKPFIMYKFDENGDKEEVRRIYQSLIKQLDESYRDDLSSGAIRTSIDDDDPSSPGKSYRFNDGFSVRVKVSPPNDDQLWSCDIFIHGKFSN